MTGAHPWCSPEKLARESEQASRKRRYTDSLIERFGSDGDAWILVHIHTSTSHGHGFSDTNYGYGIQSKPSPDGWNLGDPVNLLFKSKEDALEASKTYGGVPVPFRFAEQAG